MRQTAVARASHGGAKRAHELAGVHRALKQRLGHQPGGGGRRLGPPRLGLLLVGREEHAEDVEAGDTVDERVVGLREDREAAAIETLHEPHLPQRPVAAQVVREDSAGEHLQLVLAARLRERGVAHVVAQVEALVVDPARAGLGERNLRDALPVTRHQAEARLDVGQQPLVWGWLPGEDQRPRHVHVRGRVFQLQERCIERTEPVFGHLSPSYLQRRHTQRHSAVSSSWSQRTLT